VARIQHVTITVPAEEMLPAVEDFYIALGGVPLIRPPRLVLDTPGRWMGFDKTQVHLVIGDPVAAPAHFALDLGEDYEPVIENLRRFGADLRAARDLWGSRRTFVIDPAGNRVELFEQPPPSEVDTSR
jgi:catechol 2,3-dioxygenase-like lactoylglutathione lyase family enzyme